MSIAHSDSTHGALYPGLVLKVSIPRQTFVLFQFVGVDERKTALQRDVAFM